MKDEHSIWLWMILGVTSLLLLWFYSCSGVHNLIPLIIFGFIALNSFAKVGYLKYKIKNVDDTK